MTFPGKILAFALVLLLGGCDWLWPLDGEYDPHRCDPSCAGKQTCVNGQCVGGALDMGWPDAPGSKVDQAVGDAHVSPELLPAKEAGSDCTQGDSICLSEQTIKVCENGLWKTSSCAIECTAGGYDYSAGCKEMSGKAVCQCGKWVGYGGICTKNILCEPSLKCAAFTPGGLGFCTKTCKNNAECAGGPPNTHGVCALAISGSSGLVCGFKCDKGIYSCPPGLNCDTKDYICKFKGVPAP